MIIDEIKKANMIALKEKNKDARAIYSVLITRYQNRSIEMKESGGEMNDDETVRIIQKLLKELSEEKEGYAKVNKTDMVESITNQENALKGYLPKMLSEDEIKAIIETLPDKSIPTIMKHFKANFGSKVDMGLVNKIARSYN